MNRYKVRQVIKMLEKDGWYLNRIRGDHRQFRHPDQERNGDNPQETER